VVEYVLHDLGERVPHWGGVGGGGGGVWGGGGGCWGGGGGGGVGVGFVRGSAV